MQAFFGKFSWRCLSRSLMEELIHDNGKPTAIPAIALLIIPADDHVALERPISARADDDSTRLAFAVDEYFDSMNVQQPQAVRGTARTDSNYEAGKARGEDLQKVPSSSIHRSKRWNNSIPAHSI